MDLFTVTGNAFMIVQYFCRNPSIHNKTGPTPPKGQVQRLQQEDIISVMDKASSEVRPIARAGLIAKGTVYCLLGMLAFMAAFHINGTSSGEVNKKGVFGFVEHQPGGKVLLAIIAIGLLCYSIWRFISAFQKTETDKKTEGWGKKIRYIFSGLVYASLAYYAARMVLQQDKNSEGNKKMLAGIFQESYGQVLAGVIALVLAATGLYQCYYGLSGKYKKHVGGMGIPQKAASSLLFSGKIGYVARGIVWLTLSWML